MVLCTMVSRFSNGFFLAGSIEGTDCLRFYAACAPWKQRVSFDGEKRLRVVASYRTGGAGRLDSGDFGPALVVLRGLKLKSNQSPG
jgi:hypothetical protein